MSSKGADSNRRALAPRSLKSVQVDLTTRLGALSPTTPSGLGELDRVLNGGLRVGTMVAVSGAAGVGKTDLALFFAYMSARAGAASLWVSSQSDETETLARLAARALYREWPGANTTYGQIWSGEAWQDDARRGALGQALETVVEKVGARLHLHQPDPFEDTASLSERVAGLWGRHDRVVLVVDDVELLSAAGGDVVNRSFRTRVSQVAYQLGRVAHGGCAVVVTVQRDNASLVFPAATLAIEIAIPPDSPAREQGVFVEQEASLTVVKNRLGPTPSILVRFIRGAAVIEPIGARPGKSGG